MDVRKLLPGQNRPRAIEGAIDSRALEEGWDVNRNRFGGG